MRYQEYLINFVGKQCRFNSNDGIYTVDLTNRMNSYSDGRIINVYEDFITIEMKDSRMVSIPFSLLTVTS